MQRKYWIALWITAIILLFAGNGSLLITDSVESNYALTAKEMVLSGDWLSPQIYGHYWYDKPVFFYWLTALGFKLFGFTEFGARFFPAVFGLGALGLAIWGGRKLGGERAGFCSGLVLLSSVEFFLISKSIITDAVLFFFFSATLLFFYLGYCQGKKHYWYAMYAAAALAVLTKGPIGVLLPGLIIVLFLLWQRDYRVLGRMHLVSGTLLFAVIAVPWYAAMYMLHGSDFINTFFGVHNFLRATVSEHPRDNVIYYYTAVNLLALFPWSGLVPWAVYRWWQQGHYKIEREQGFLILWAAVVFFFFQNMATKYITYTYPLLFPMSLLLGKMLAQEMEVCSGGYLIFVGCGFSLLLGGAAYTAVKGLIPTELLFLIPLSLIIGILIEYLLRLRTGQHAIGVAALSLCFYLALIYSVAVPLSEMRSAKNLGTMLVQEHAKEVGLFGKYPTSAVFYSNTKVVNLIKQRDVASYQPKSMSWSSKNVMPYGVLEEMPYNMVAVASSSLNRFLRENGDNCQIVSRNDKWLLLEKRS